MTKLDDTDWRASLAQSIEEFKNRRRYATLTPELLAGVHDDQLEQVVLDFINDRADALGTSVREVLADLPVEFASVYATWWVEAEVQNGGFNQYFWNPAGEFASDAEAGFEQIGAPEVADLMRRAIAIHRDYEHRLKAFKKSGTAEAFVASYSENPLSALDREYYALAGPLSQKRIDFIRANPESFCAP